ncbi:MULTISPECIES: glycosyltransferase family 2 protein [Thomasclavelia]|uniref:glycosyltransferase family 2 protein n=1 Tax=Thomasclavelia TaxID=3025755 RepID=UPI0032089B14
MIKIISIIVPTYNRGHVIKRTIDNLLNQTIDDFEIIIVDDCSTDDTQHIIKNYNDIRIRYYKNTVNMGACYSRNRGIKLSHGDYIAFQDSDDLWDKNKLKKQLEFLSKYDADVVFCKMEQLDEYGQNYNIIPDRLIHNKNISYDDLLKGNLISTQTILAKKICFSTVKFDENLPRFQDWDLAIKLSMEYTVFFQDELLVTQYIQSDSITKNYFKAITALKIIYSKYYVKNNDRYSQYYYWNLLATCQYQVKDKNVINSYLKAFKYKKSFKLLIKIFLCRSNLLNLFLKVKR